MVLVLAGLAWGFAVPLTPHPRLALGAHIQLVTNGLLLTVLAMALLTLPHRVGSKSVGMMVIAVWLTWAMVLSEVANSWWGTKQTLPLAASEAGATGGAAWQELVVSMTHFAAGAALVIAWGLLVAGFLKQPSGTGQTRAEGPEHAE